MIKKYHFLNVVICFNDDKDNILKVVKQVRQQGYCLRELDENAVVTESDDVFVNNNICEIIKILDNEQHDIFLNKAIVLLSNKINEKTKTIVKIRGNCMEPHIIHDTMICVRKKSEQITVGSIILFSREMRLYLHRVIVVARIGNERCYITKGDNAILWDRLVMEEQIIGVL